MSRNRVSPEAGWVRIKDRPRGPNGRGLCRQCNQEVPPGRLTFCGDTCVDAWRVKTSPAHARRLVRKRDRGVCAECGLDTKALDKWLRTLVALVDRHHDSWYQPASRRRTSPRRARYGVIYRAVLEFLLDCGFGTRTARTALQAGRTPSISDVLGHGWEADHIVPVVEGGGECGLENYRTLCVPCHKRATRALRQRMTARPVRRAMPPKPAELT